MQQGKPILADHQLVRPIRDVVWAASRVVQRLTKRRYFRSWDEEKRRVYMDVLRIRAAEVIEYAESVGITGMNEAFVRANPFLAAATIEQYLGSV